MTLGGKSFSEGDLKTDASGKPDVLLTRLDSAYRDSQGRTIRLAGQGQSQPDTCWIHRFPLVSHRGRLAYPCQVRAFESAGTTS